MTCSWKSYYFYYLRLPTLLYSELFLYHTKINILHQYCVLAPKAHDILLCGSGYVILTHTLQACHANSIWLQLREGEGRVGVVDLSNFHVFPCKIWFVIVNISLTVLWQLLRIHKKTLSMLPLK